MWGVEVVVVDIGVRRGVALCARSGTGPECPQKHKTPETAGVRQLGREQIRPTDGQDMRNPVPPPAIISRQRQATTWRASSKETANTRLTRARTPHARRNGSQNTNLDSSTAEQRVDGCAQQAKHAEEAKQAEHAKQTTASKSKHKQAKTSNINQTHTNTDNNKQIK